MPRQEPLLSASQRLALRVGLYAIGLFWGLIGLAFTAAPCFAAVYSLGKFPERSRPYVALAGWLISILAGWFVLWRRRRHRCHALKATMLWWYAHITKQKYPDN